MIRSRCLCHFCLYLLIASLLFPVTALCGETEKKYEPDKAIIEASKKTAKELGYNPIPVFVKKKGGSNFVTGGVRLSIRNGRLAFVDGDMVINVGQLAVTVADVTLSKCEYAVVKGGKLVKQAGRITATANRE